MPSDGVSSAMADASTDYDIFDTDSCASASCPTETKFLKRIKRCSYNYLWIELCKTIND